MFYVNTSYKTMLNIKKLYPDVVEPVRSHSRDSGLDLCAYSPNQDIILYPKSSPLYAVHKINTGIAIQLSQSDKLVIDQDDNSYNLIQEAQIRGRSGLASQGIYCHLGTIDNSYTGEIKVLLTNISNPEPFTIKHGMRIAQLVIQTVLIPQINYVLDFEETDRNIKGFGSTGV